MSGHTSGSWTAVINDNLDPLVVSGYALVARILSHRTFRHHADAHLIAAAPDMLAAVKEGVESIRALRIALDSYRGLSSEQSESLFIDQTADMRAAIAKAEGKA